MLVRLLEYWDRLVAAAAAISLAFAWGPALQGQAIPTAAEQLPRYDMKVDYQPEKQSFGVSGAISLPATAGARDYVEVSLAEAMGDPHFSALSARGIPLKAKVEKVARPGAPSAGWRTTTWRVQPSQPFPGGEPVRLRFSYSVRGELAANLVYAGPTIAFGTGALSAWYPEMEREPVGEDGALRGLRGTGRILFSVPDGFTIFANGDVGHRSERQVEYRFGRPIFFAFAAGRYQKEARAGDIPTSAYQLRARPSTGDLLRRSQAIVSLLAKEFYPYPYREFAIVEVPTDLAQKAGFAGACLEGFIFSTSEFLDKKFNTAFFAHEIGHQWWPYMLGPRGERGNYLLTDAMVQYGSLRAVEIMEGPEAAERYRRTGHSAFFPEFSGTGFLQLAAAGYDMPLAQTYSPAHPSGRLSFSLTGSKGMFVWDTLAREIGRERFQNTLRTLIGDNMYQRLTVPEFRAKFSAAAGTNLSWFFEQWWDREGAPELSLSWRQRNGRVVGTVTQRGAPYRITVPVDLVARNGIRERRQLTVSGPTTRFSWRVSLPLRSVLLDSRYEVLRWTEEYRAEARALAPYTRANFALISRSSEEAIPLFRAGLAEVRGDGTHGVSFLLHYGLSDALFSTEKYAEAWQETEAALASRHKRADVLPLVHLMRARIAKRQGNQAALEEAVREASKADLAVGGNTGAGEQAAALLAQEG